MTMFDRVTLYRIGWSATFACVAISVFVARTWLRQSWRLYCAMALFACGWMLVLPTYGAPTDTLTPEERKLISFASDIVSILFAFTGALLVGDVRTRRADRPVEVSWELRASMGLLFFLAAPAAISIPTSPFGALIQEWFGITQIADKQVGLVVSTFLNLAGFFALARGVYHMHGPTKIYKTFAVILIGYFLMTVFRAFELWTSYVPTKEVYVLVVSLAKLLTTILFSYAVITYARSAAVRPRQQYGRGRNGAHGRPAAAAVLMWRQLQASATATPRCPTVILMRPAAWSSCRRRCAVVFNLTPICLPMPRILPLALPPAAPILAIASAGKTSRGLPPRGLGGLG
jgi:hypothetical protein